VKNHDFKNLSTAYENFTKIEEYSNLTKNIEKVKESVLDHFFVFDLPKDFNTKESIGVELPKEVHRYYKK
jgi:hypothetical protein